MAPLLTYAVSSIGLRRKLTVTKKKKTQRAPLTQARVVETAMALADAGGTAALSMRSLAEALGVEAMSLYHHVANKDELLDLMVDAVFTTIALPDEGSWASAMRARAVSIRQALARHPWAVGLLESRKRPGLPTLRHHDATIGRLRRAGLSVQMVAHALAVLDSYVYGFALQELGLPFSGPEEAAEVAGGIFERMPVDQLPHLAELAMQHVMVPGYAFGDEFEYGLDLVLDALESRLTHDARPPGKRR